ncbi:unnamed protein product, partial [Cyprideis torosa]
MWFRSAAEKMDIQLMVSQVLRYFQVCFISAVFFAILLLFYNSSISEIRPFPSLPSQDWVPSRRHLQQIPPVNQSAPTTSSTSTQTSANKKAAKTLADLFEPGFQIPGDDICGEDQGKGVLVLILVTSAPGSSEKRRAIRETWGHYSLRRDVTIAFVVGNTTESSYQAVINEESKTFGDIIQERNVDSYQNLTLKTQSLLDWTMAYCPNAQFLLKTDDDMYINIKNLLNF